MIAKPYLKVFETIVAKPRPKSILSPCAKTPARSANNPPPCQGGAAAEGGRGVFRGAGEVSHLRISWGQRKPPRIVGAAREPPIKSIGLAHKLHSECRTPHPAHLWGARPPRPPNPPARFAGCPPCQGGDLEARSLCCAQSQRGASNPRSPPKGGSCNFAQSLPCV